MASLAPFGQRPALTSYWSSYREGASAISVNTFWLVMEETMPAAEAVLLREEMVLSGYT